MVFIERAFDNHYSIQLNWNPPDDSVSSVYDLYCGVTNAIGTGHSGYEHNQDVIELVLPPTCETFCEFYMPCAELVVGSPVNEFERQRCLGLCRGAPDGDEELTCLFNAYLEDSCNEVVHCGP